MTCTARTMTKQQTPSSPSFLAFASISKKTSISGWVERPKRHDPTWVVHKTSKEMKREGRRHGIVRTQFLLPPPWNSRIKNKVINECNSPPTAGSYAKVLLKPNNHSKFTGKCGKPRCMGCHLHPACKSRGKAKGTQKLKSYDVALNHRLLEWRVVDKCVGLNCTGVSASDMLSHLYAMHSHEMYEEAEDGEEEGMVEGQVSFVDGLAMNDCNVEEAEDIEPSGVKIEEDDEDVKPSGVKIGVDDEDAGAIGVNIEEDVKPGGVKIGEDDEDTRAIGVDIEEDDDMGFYCVGIVWDYVDDDGDWCVVGEM